jgi:hypothetical protein
MRLTDLLGAEVVDQDGRAAGRVRDVRLVQDGPVVGPFGAALRVDGLVVGRLAAGARFGYDRLSVRGPLPVRLLLGWLQRGARYVPWSRVRSLEPGRIRIAGTAADLPAPAVLR